MGTRRVPWRDWDEWEEVRVGLTGLDRTARDAALRAVDGWRRRGRVPHAIDVTAQLMEARTHDRGVPGSQGTCSARARVCTCVLLRTWMSVRGAWT